MPGPSPDGIAAVPTIRRTYRPGARRPAGRRALAGRDLASKSSRRRDPDRLVAYRGLTRHTRSAPALAGAVLLDEGRCPNATARGVASPGAADRHRRPLADRSARAGSGSAADDPPALAVGRHVLRAGAPPSASAATSRPACPRLMAEPSRRPTGTRGGLRHRHPGARRPQPARPGRGLRHRCRRALLAGQYARDNALAASFFAGSHRRPCGRPAALDLALERDPEQTSPSCRHSELVVAGNEATRASSRSRRGSRRGPRSGRLRGDAHAAPAGGSRFTRCAGR
jgi:hypothetical protein